MVYHATCVIHMSGMTSLKDSPCRNITVKLLLPMDRIIIMNLDRFLATRRHQEVVEMSLCSTPRCQFQTYNIYCSGTTWSLNQQLIYLYLSDKFPLLIDLLFFIVFDLLSFLVLFYNTAEAMLLRYIFMQFSCLISLCVSAV